MAVTITGFAQSSYVWTARAALTIRQIDHEFVPLNPGEHKSPDHLARHPFGKVPALNVDGQDLFETSAIVRWAEAKGAGHALFPSEAFAAAKVEQWISATSAYLYGPIVPGYILKYAFAGEQGPDRGEIEAAVPVIAERLAVFDNAIDHGPWLVGDQLTAADLFLGPLVLGLGFFPEGKGLLDQHPKLGRLIGELTGNAGFMAGAPPR